MNAANISIKHRTVILNYIYLILGALSTSLTIIHPVIAQEVNSTQPNSVGTAIKMVFYKEEFYRNLFIVLATAVIGGIAVNIVKGRLDDRSSSYKKLLDQKAAFLAEFSDIIWDFYFSVIKVSFCYSECQSQGLSQERCAKVCEDFEKNLGMLFTRLEKCCPRQKCFRTPQCVLQYVICMRKLLIRS